MIPVLGVTYGRMKKQDVKYFIEKARSVHGDRYDYSKSVYINSRVPIVITCPEHGDFTIRAAKHLFGQKCRECANCDASKRYSKNISKFIEDARKVHGDKFDYSLVEYKNQDSRIKIICPVHGEFEQTAKDHVVRKIGCAECSREKNSGWTTSDWKKRVGGDGVLKLYYIECWSDTERFYKIGLTCKNKVEYRFHGKEKMPYNYRIINIIEGKVEDLVKLERKFKKQILNMHDKYAPKIQFSGSTYECFQGKFIPDFKEMFEGPQTLE
jgi:hypothetical protein